jgi:hypothetical protein
MTTLLCSIFRRLFGRCPACGCQFVPMDPRKLDALLGDGWTYQFPRQCWRCGWVRFTAVKEIT